MSIIIYASYFLIAFLVGGSVSIIEMWTGDYCHIFFLQKRIPALWTYSSIYGIFACILLLLSILFYPDHPLGIAAALIFGFTAKGLMNAPLYEKTGNNPTALTISHLATSVDKRILEVYNSRLALELYRYLEPYVNTYHDIEDVKYRILSKPPTLGGDKEYHDALELDLDDSMASQSAPREKVREAMKTYLLRGGKELFEETFLL